MCQWRFVEVKKTKKKTDCHKQEDLSFKHLLGRLPFSNTRSDIPQLEPIMSESMKEIHIFEENQITALQQREVKLEPFQSIFITGKRAS